MNILKKANKKSTGENLATNSILLVFVKCVTISVGIIQTMILARTFTKTDYGTYSQANLIISFLAPFFSLGLDNAVNYFFNNSKLKGKREDYINTIFFISLLSGLLCGILLLLFKGQIVGYFDNPALVALLIYIAFRPCTQNIISLYQPAFVSSGHAKMIALRNLIISILQVCIISGISIFIKNLTLIFFLLLVLDFAQIVLFNLYFRKRVFCISVFKPKKALFKEILIYAMPMLLATSVGTISINLDKAMVAGLMSTEDYALYSNVSKELPFSFIAGSFTTVIIPVIIKYLNSGEKEKFKKLWAEYLELGYLVTWPLCIGAAVLAPELIEVLYSKTYLSKAGITVFVIYTVVAMLRFTYFGMVPSALGKTKIVMRYSVISCIVNVILNYPFYYLFGMPGPAVATVISMLVSAALYFKTSANMVQIKVREILKPIKIIILAIEMSVAGVIVRILAAAMENYIDSVLIRFCLGYLLFGVIILLFKYKEIKRLIITMNSEH